VPLPCASSSAAAAISYASVQKMPESSTRSPWRGARGGAINVVRAKTVDLMVRQSRDRHRGLINTQLLEPRRRSAIHALKLQEYNAFMEVTAITRRHRFLTSFISQVRPANRA